MLPEPFRTRQPFSGPVGTVVTITGVSLTQTKTVTFGGVKATTFTVNNDSKVTATRPDGSEDRKDRDHHFGRQRFEPHDLHGDVESVTRRFGRRRRSQV